MGHWAAKGTGYLLSNSTYEPTQLKTALLKEPKCGSPAELLSSYEVPWAAKHVLDVGNCNKLGLADATQAPLSVNEK